MFDKPAWCAIPTVGPTVRARCSGRRSRLGTSGYQNFHTHTFSDLTLTFRYRYTQDYHFIPVQTWLSTEWHRWKGMGKKERRRKGRRRLETRRCVNQIASHGNHRCKARGDPGDLNVGDGNEACSSKRRVRYAVLPRLKCRSRSATRRIFGSHDALRSSSTAEPILTGYTFTAIPLLFHSFFRCT